MVSDVVTYTITVDATLVLGVVIYHVLLVLIHIVLQPRNVKARPPPPAPEPNSPRTPPTDEDLVTCRAPALYYARREGVCYHIDVNCTKLNCARSTCRLRPCTSCVSVCTMHKMK